MSLAAVIPVALAPAPVSRTIAIFSAVSFLSISVPILIIMRGTGEPMIFKVMTLKERQESVKDCSDPLTEEYKKEQEYYSKIQCIRCGEKVYSIPNAKRPFTEGRLIPNTLAKCSACEVEFEPYTRLEVTPPRISIDLL